MEAALSEGLRALLAAHRERYPLAAGRDYYKLLYQNEFGCGHMAPARGAAEAALCAEYAAAHGAPAAPGPAAPGVPGRVEDIGGGLCRVWLDGVWRTGDLRLLGRMFCATARLHAGAAARFSEKLALLEAWAGQALPAGEAQDVRAACCAGRQAGFPAVHHSDAFRARYAPHYRVVLRAYALAWPALALAENAAAGRAPALLAIDGRCGSGKTTLAAHIAQVFGCPVFHMDDFFLPPALRTPQRLAAPGENVHHERFLAEVLRPFAAGRPVRFCPFDCAQGDFAGAVEVPPASFAVVEGSYAMHPALRGFYTAAVFVTCPPDVQRARLLARCGAEYYKVFERRWIPLEEAYFAARGVEALCGVTLDTGAAPAL